MSDVYANGMEVSSKSMGGKSICEFPDVCFTPPLTPATPPGVPIPYPNTAMASDTSDGSTSVKIAGKEAMLKNKSYFKKSMGDEAGSAPKKGLLTSKIQGKVYFIAWSMDVKIEGENVVRNLDMTTHNHACSFANGSVPTVHAAKMMLAPDLDKKCEKDAQKVEDNCKADATGKEPNHCPGILNMPVTEQRVAADPSKPGPRIAEVKPHQALISKDLGGRSMNAGAVAEAEAESSPCVKAMRCVLRPYNAEPRDGKTGCCIGQTPHHIPPKNTLLNANVKGYSDNKALCVCLEGSNQHAGSHGMNHAAIDHAVGANLGAKPNDKVNLADYNRACAAAVAAQCGCEAGCIEKQLDNHFKNDQKIDPAKTDVKHWDSSCAQLDAKTPRNEAIKSSIDNLMSD